MSFATTENTVVSKFYILLSIKKYITKLAVMTNKVGTSQTDVNIC
jgi:hypothetical protein